MTKEEKSAYYKAYYLANKEKHNALTKAWHAANKEKTQALNKKWYLANKEEHKAKSAQRYEANKEECKARSAKYYQENKEKRTAQTKAWYEANKEKRTAQIKAWAEDNPEKQRAIGRKSEAKRRALMSNTSMTELDEFAWDEAVSLAKAREETLGGKWHIDHIVPLKHKDACGLHTAANWQVVPAEWNRSKGNRNMDEYEFNIGDYNDRLHV